MKDFADDNFKFDKNGRKLSKLVENTVGKGEVARYKQFLFFPQCFKKACFPGASKGVIVWEWVKHHMQIFELGPVCIKRGHNQFLLQILSLSTCQKSACK